MIAYDLTAKLWDAKPRIAAAFEAYRLPRRTRAKAPTCCRRASLALPATNRRAQPARGSARTKPTRKLRAAPKWLDAFLGKLKRTNATPRKTAAYTGNLINWIEREEVQPGP